MKANRVLFYDEPIGKLVYCPTELNGKKVGPPVDECKIMNAEDKYEKQERMDDRVCWAEYIFFTAAVGFTTAAAHGMFELLQC